MIGNPFNTRASSARYQSWWSDTWHGFTGRTQRKAAEAQIRALNESRKQLRTQQRMTEVERLRTLSEQEYAAKGIRRRQGNLRRRGRQARALNPVTGADATPNL